MIYFTAHTFKCVCHCRRAMFRVLGMYNFASDPKKYAYRMSGYILQTDIGIGGFSERLMPVSSPSPLAFIAPNQDY